MPYIGYFSLIKHTDVFILFDTVQFIRHGWIERNRMLKQNGDWQYIQVPLIKNNGRDTIIKDLRINNAEPWQQKIFAQIQHYKRKAPYYYKVVNLLHDILDNEYNDIVTLNKISLQKTCEYLGIAREFTVFSEMNLAIEPVTAPDEWALNICKEIPNTEEYWNPIGGLSFFDKNKYNQAGLKIFFQEVALTPYNQRMENFEAGLSILDVMMFNSIEEVNKMLDNYTLK